MALFQEIPTRSDTNPGETTLPNFFLVGAPKAGTTSLYHYLDQHPEIYMSPLKEISYFSSEVRSESFASSLRGPAEQGIKSMRRYLDSGAKEKRFGGIVSEWEDYCSLFARAEKQRAIGEASVCYLWSSSAAQNIAAHIPHAKILIVLRNPVERAFSQYLHNLSDGVVQYGFREHLDAALFHRHEGKFSVLHPFLELGLYADQVLRYQQNFPKAQIGLWLYEETRTPKFLNDVMKFLGVDSAFTPDTAKRYLEQEIPKFPGLRSTLRNSALWRGLREAIPAPVRTTLHDLAYKKKGAVKLQSTERALLLEYYRQDILKLQTILQRDLSTWLVE
jgi:hypothetical protein